MILIDLNIQRLFHYHYFKLLILSLTLINSGSVLAHIPGLQYERLLNANNQLIHFVEVDPKHLDIRPAAAKTSGLGRESVSYIAKRHQAIVGINGGFFQVAKTLAGIPAGVLKIDEQWYSIAYRPRGAIGWKTDNPSLAFIDRVQTKTRVKINQTYFPVHTMNWPNRLKQAVLYTPSFGEEIGGNRNGTNVRIVSDRVIEVQTQQGHTPIPEQGYVYSIGPHMKRQLAPISVGDKASISVQVLPQLKPSSQPQWQTFDNIVGGAPVLIFNGEIITDFSSESIRDDFIQESTARTAIGLLPNHHWLLVVVEQNPFLGTSGVSLMELAQLMKERGCETALNLDGGSSSSIYLHESVVQESGSEASGREDNINYSSLKRVSDAILVLPKDSG